MPAYSREITVKAIRSYYAFLAAKLGAIRPSCIIEPPVGGWPNITTASLAPLEKTDEVVDLLRHLPYIKRDSTSEWNEKIAPDTDAFRYGGADVMPSNGTASDMWPPGAGEIPAHVAVLTMGARYGSWLLLDTVEGTVTDFIQQERPERSEPTIDSPDYWRAYKTLPVQDFFKQWEENFRTLEWVVNPHDVDDGMMLRYDQETDEVRQIYREYGWFDNFNMKGCHQALLEWHNRPFKPRSRLNDYS